MILTLLIIVFVGGLLLYGVVMLGAVNIAGGGKAKSSKKHYRGHLDRALVAERWATIQAMSQGGGNGLRQAVSEADKLFDYVMKTQGYPGQTMADRLKVAQSKLSDRNAVWNAHKLRNALAHEVGFDLVASQVRQALQAFERGLKDLGAL
jgi:hypothetical protein